VLNIISVTFLLIITLLSAGYVVVDEDADMEA